MRRIELMLLTLCIAGCTSLLPGEGQRLFTQRRSAMVCPAAAPIVRTNVPGRPFEALASGRGRWVFASLMPSGAKRKAERTGGGIAVLHWSGRQLVLRRVVPLPSIPTGMALSHDGRLLVVADSRDVDFLDVPHLVSGSADPLLGSIRDAAAAGSVYAAISVDDRTLFVSNESVSTVTVIDLQRARITGFPQDAIVGNISTGNAPVGLAVSPDGRDLFITSEFWPPGPGSPTDCRSPAGFGPARSIPAGAVEVVDIARARRRPRDAVIGWTWAGCMPVRAALSADGARLYVTARGSNAMLAFDAARLLTHPTHALLATVPVGAAPVGLAVAEQGRRIVVADSSRFGDSGGSDLTIIDAARIVEGRAAVIGTIAAGQFPRELHKVPDGRALLLTDTDSKQIERIPSACLASASSRPQGATAMAPHGTP